MSLAQLHVLSKFLKPFPKDIKTRVQSLCEFIYQHYPTANELIYDNYNAVAVGWSPTDRMGHVFCSVAVGRTSHNVHFGFLRGAALSDPKKLLIGEGNQYRYILVTDFKKFPGTYIARLMKESYANSLSMVRDPASLKEGLTLVKSISAKKRTRNGDHQRQKNKRQSQVTA